MIYEHIIKNYKQGEKQLAVLIDPGKLNPEEAIRITERANQFEIDYIFIGGSLVSFNAFDAYVKTIKSAARMPVLLFPGNIQQLSIHADALLLLSLISGRNADMLIGQHVQAAHTIRKIEIEPISTGYILIDGGNITSAQYMSGTLPIPASSIDIAVSTALAGVMLGLRLIYLDAGSGAIHTVPAEMISAVKSAINVPLITGGGICTAQEALDAWQAGADIIVIGNAIEKNISLINEICASLRKINHANYCHI